MALGILSFSINHILRFYEVGTEPRARNRSICRRKPVIITIIDNYTIDVSLMIPKISYQSGYLNNPTVVCIDLISLYGMCAHPSLTVNSTVYEP